jgi:hypothetical protein
MGKKIIMKIHNYGNKYQFFLAKFCNLVIILNESHVVTFELKPLLNWL